MSIRLRNPLVTVGNGKVTQCTFGRKTVTVRKRQRKRNDIKIVTVIFIFLFDFITTWILDKSFF